LGGWCRGIPSGGMARCRAGISAIWRRSDARLTGRLAWLVWGMAHIYFLIGFRNRLAVAVDWLWSYLTYQRGARLITGQDMRMGPASSKQ